MITRNHEESVILSRGFTDIIKFAAALLVAFGHYSSYALEFSSNPIYKVTVLFAGDLGVALFFFLSGYGLMMSERKHHLAFWPFLKRRLSKVYLPVVFVTFVWQLILWPSNSGWERIPKLLYSVFWGFSDGILWFVKVIFVCYILFRIYLISKSRKLIILFFGTSIVYFFVYVYFASYAAISIPLFSLGILVADYNSFFSRLARSAWMFAVMVAITLLMVGLYIWQGNLYLHCLTNWYAVSVLVVVCSSLNIEIKAPSEIGGVSYDIFLTHNKVINYLRPVYTQIGLLHFIIGVVIAAAASYTIRKQFRI